MQALCAYIFQLILCITAKNSICSCITMIHFYLSATDKLLFLKEKIHKTINKMVSKTIIP